MTTDNQKPITIRVATRNFNEEHVMERLAWAGAPVKDGYLEHGTVEAKDDPEDRDVKIVTWTDR